MTASVSVKKATAQKVHQPWFWLWHSSEYSSSLSDKIFYFRVDEMGRDIIAAAKDIIVSQQNTEQMCGMSETD